MGLVTRRGKNLDAVVNVRLTSEEKSRLQEDARLAGLPVSELVRRRYFGRPVVAASDIQVVKELRRIGGLMKHVHNQSGGVYNKETAEVLGALRTYIDKLAG